MLLFAAFNGASKKKQSRRVLNNISHKLTPTVSVERDGKWIKLDSKQLVKGELISLKRGDVLAADVKIVDGRSEEHTSELQSRFDLVCRLLLEKKNQPSPLVIR